MGHIMGGYCPCTLSIMELGQNRLMTGFWFYNQRRFVVLGTGPTLTGGFSHTKECSTEQVSTLHDMWFQGNSSGTGAISSYLNGETYYLSKGIP